MNNVRVTIGICAKNSEKTINNTVRSLLTQDYPLEKIQIVFVDDGSNDQTLNIINKICSEINIITKVFHHDWQGLGYSRNLVVNNAKGKFILWVDSDMILSRNYVRKLVNFMDENLNVGIAKGKYDITSATDWLSALEMYSRSKMGFDFNKNPSKSIGTGGSIYRVKALKDVGGFNKNLKGYGEDWNVEFKMRNVGWKFSIVDCVFTDYEKYGITWKQLWQRYFKRGYDGCKSKKLTKEMVRFYKMIPITSFIAGFIDSLTLYKTTHRKIVFLLPIQYMVKSFFWCNGYIYAHLDSRLHGTRSRARKITS